MTKGIRGVHDNGDGSIRGLEVAHGDDDGTMLKLDVVLRNDDGAIKRLVCVLEYGMDTDNSAMDTADSARDLRV